MKEESPRQVVLDALEPVADGSKISSGAKREEGIAC